MSSELSLVSPTTGFATTILKILLGEWQPILSGVAKLFAYLTRERPTGPFEVLEYDSTLEILDAKGYKAIVSRQLRVRFLQDHVIAFQDYAWGDGEVLADYKIAPGIIADTYQDGDRWVILISLRETKNKGDVSEFNIERTLKDSFTQEIEWLQTQVWLPTRHLKLRVVYPKNRPPTRANMTQRSGNRTTELNKEHFQELPDGRQIVTWEKHYPRRSEIYTLKWEW